MRNARRRSRAPGRDPSRAAAQAAEKNGIDFRLWYGEGLHRQTYYADLAQDSLAVTTSAHEPPSGGQSSSTAVHPAPSTPDPLPACGNTSLTGKSKLGKVVVGSGWWSDVVPHDWAIGSAFTKSVAFFDLWYQQVVRCLQPDRVVVIDSASPIKPDYRSYPIEWIELDRNYGHPNDIRVHRIATKYSGFTRSVIGGAMYALCCDADFYVYVEQDCLLHGGDFLALALGSTSQDILLGAPTENGKGLVGNIAAPMLQQSLMIVRRTGLERFLEGLLGAPWTDGERSPEEIMRLRLAPYDFVQVPYGRSRPIDFYRRNFYAQHLDDHELRCFLTLVGYEIPAQETLVAPDLYAPASSPSAKRFDFRIDMAEFRGVSDRLLSGQRQAPEGDLPELEYYLHLSEQVPGWTRHEEALELVRASLSLPADAVVVEIGSFMGSGTILLAGARKVRGSGRVHVVDPFDCSGDHFSVPVYNDILVKAGGGSLRGHFEENIRDAGLSDWVEVHQGRAAEIAARWSTPVDLIFFDGDQSRAGVREAYQSWSPFLKLGGVVAVHNSSADNHRPEHDGHRCLVEEEISLPHYTDVRCVYTTTFARKVARTSTEERTAGFRQS